MAAETHLFLVRHAIAEERGPAWPDDEQRPLTADGARKWKRAARGLSTLLPKVDALFTSPLLRASQTAQTLAHALSPSPKLQIFDPLRPDARPRDTLAALRDRHVKGSLVLVGHEPMLSELAATLLQLEGPVAFKKGAVMALASEGLGTRGPARLEWFLPPRILRELTP